MNFIQLCEEVNEWSIGNFGQDSAENKALGFVEETGELVDAFVICTGKIAHSLLKMRQGIRGTKEEHYLKMCDAIGDCMVYLADFCSKANFVKSFTGRESLNKDFVDWENYYHSSLKRKQNSTLLLLDSLGQIEYLLRNIGETFSPGIYVEICIENLIHFCQENEIHFAETIEATWMEVKKRDWEKNKLTGEV